MIIEDQLDVADDDDTGESKNLAVIVSAMGGKPKVTDLLLGAVRYASIREREKVAGQLNVVREKHRTCLEVLFCQDCNGEKERLMGVIEGGLDDIRDILKTVSIMKWQAERISGEYNSTHTVDDVQLIWYIFAFM